MPLFISLRITDTVVILMEREYGDIIQREDFKEYQDMQL